ncbi:MAG: M20/M25/M40 family metallo-hydrolase [Clostridia bacterium]|nr:M20/M25/M40 family metallo-hydrolase [Clostridia bacterium]
MLNILELQKQLVEVALPSGFEKPQGKLLAQLAKPYVDEVFSDALGNVYCHKKGPGKRMMFPAHMDVIGMMITFVDDKGFLRFEAIGGHSPAGLIGITVRLESGVRGTIRADAAADVYKHGFGDVDVHDLYIDIGAESKDEAEALAPIGSVCMFDAPTTMGAGNAMISPYTDDLCGCIALLIAMEELKDTQVENDLWFVFTVQEEVGLRGAKPAAWDVQPDMGIAVDVTRTGDTSGEIDGQRMQVVLGKGPTVKIKDSSVQCNPQVIEHLRKAAKENKIPYQDEILLAGGTDTAAVQKTRAGILSGCVSIPCRNIHAPAEIVDLKDVENVGKLLAAAAKIAL